MLYDFKHTPYPMLYEPVAVARQFQYIRESTQNHGLRVEAIQHWCDGQPGDSWCDEFATMVLDICFQGHSLIPRGTACQEVYDFAKENGWIRTVPVINDLFLYVDSNDHAHHIGFVTNLTPLTGIAGNTSPDGTSSNGDGVYEHPIASTTFVHYPR